MTACTTNFQALISANNIAAYMGHTPASHGQTGETAYLLDIEYYNKIMKKLA